MKKVALSVLLLLLFTPIWACSWYSPDYQYYNLFAQEVISSPRYFPFLMTKEYAYYSTNVERKELNENIEAWQNHLKTTYDQAYYLVFQSQREDLMDLLSGKQIRDEKLTFIDASFIKEHIQELEYLAYAKYLEPYMSIKSSGNYYWGDEPLHYADELDYDLVINELKKRWESVNNKNLKLRYGYQLVRFAHYNWKYEDSKKYFNLYVERLDYRPIMYYYALDQKGGAERGLGNYVQANYDFFQFFNHTKNRKAAAYTSMKITDGVDFENLLKQAKTESERNDIYLLLGYNDFNNPMSSFEKIVEHSPNAVQAKVLMARAINQLERSFLPLTYYCPYDDKSCKDHIDDHRLPISLDQESIPFLQQCLQASFQQINNPAIKDRSFWNLTTSYLHFIQKDYEKAKSYLADVKSNEKFYLDQKEKLAMLIDISEQRIITPEFEQTLISKYKKYLGERPYYSEPNSTQAFIIDILANRYFLQKEYARAFLLQNNIMALEYKPNLEILQGIEKLYYKKNKTTFEKYIAQNIIPTSYFSENGGKSVRNMDFESYVANMKGTLLLSQGNFRKASKFFDKVSDGFTLLRSEYFINDKSEYSAKKIEFPDSEYDGYSNIPAQMFGYNQIECFECPTDMVMKTDYLNDFRFIKPLMNKKTLTEALVKLDKIAKGNSQKTAKANYLIANFFFNTSLLGYYRQVLTFDIDNSNGPKFHNYGYYNYHPNSPFQLYYKNYTSMAAYDDNFKLPLMYLDRALVLTGDDELKARILFAASKCEQGIYYGAADKDEELKALSERYDNRDFSWKEYNAAKWKLKVRKYRKYFAELKNFDHTDFYEEVRSNCLTFDYYLTHY